MSLARSFMVVTEKPASNRIFAAAAVLRPFKIATTLTNDPERNAASKAIVSGDLRWVLAINTGGDASLVAVSCVAPNMSSCIKISKPMLIKE